MVAFDQAWVRRKGKEWIRHGGKALCEVCGAQDDCAQRVTEPVACGLYVPVISFKDATGLCGAFNTFRRGAGWGNRLKLGQTVALWNLAAGERVGTARVDGIHIADLGDLLGRLAAMNHLMKASDERTAPERLHRILRQLYGSTYAAASEKFTVVELVRL